MLQIFILLTEKVQKTFIYLKNTFCLKLKKKIKKILDFGCAAGNFKNIFNKLYGSHFYCGIDADKKMIQIAKK